MNIFPEYKIRWSEYQHDDDDPALPARLHHPLMMAPYFTQLPPQQPPAFILMPQIVT